MNRLLTPKECAAMMIADIEAEVAKMPPADQATARRDIWEAFSVTMFAGPPSGPFLDPLDDGGPL